MTDHQHCFCFPCSIYETYMGGTYVDENGKKQPSKSFGVRDIMCCHCGAFKEGKMVFVQTPGHGILRHNTRKVQHDDKKN